MRREGGLPGGLGRKALTHASWPPVIGIKFASSPAAELVCASELVRNAGAAGALEPLGLQESVVIVEVLRELGGLCSPHQSCRKNGSLLSAVANRRE
jgi:hypothetical protein